MTRDAANNRFEVVCFAEALWDCFPDYKVVGGAPLNVAFMLHALGARVDLITRVGNDENGRDLVRFIADHGLDTRFVQVDDRHETGRVPIKLLPNGDADFEILPDVAYDHIAWQPEHAEVVRRSHAVCFGTVAQRSPVSRAALSRLLDHAGNALRVYDINLRKKCYSKELVEAGMRRASLVKMNDEEYRLLEGLFPEIAGGGAPAFMRRFAIKMLAVTRGAKGCALHRGTDSADVKGIRVQVQDTVGAGDAFTASMILGCLRGDPLTRIAEEANLLGAYVATQQGATPPIEGYRQKIS